MYSIGEKVLELCSFRDKGFKRETKIVSILQFIHNNVWKMLFNKQADGLQKSTDDPDEYRIIENTPLVNKFITLQKGNSLNCASIFAGVIEGILNSADFRCKVSAFFYDIDGQSKTYYIIKFDSDVIARDNEIK
jgi:trafficking protein particle complex subunit 5